MRLSRFVTAIFVAGSAVVLAANPGCSSNNAVGPGQEGGTLDSSFADNFVPRTDGGTKDGGKDGPGMLMTGGDSHAETSIVKEAGFNDAKLKDVATDGCVPDAGSDPGPVQHICIIYPSGTDSDNECDGHHDIPGFPPNGTGGNGFDDNCNGLVDEGCSCQNVGTTKTCYLVPSSQTVNGIPVGWCTENSKGTVNCAQQGEGGPTWSGQCRGAQAPYADDFCAKGDFNCDGKEENSKSENCSCKSGLINCPTEPVTTVPYPPVNALPLAINAGDWFANPADVASATDWKWTLTGGDCDNILPFPTFGIYGSANASGNPVSTPNNMLGVGMNEHGVTAGSPKVSSAIYPAFSLSGDYLLNASWTLNNKPYSCSLKVQVRAPGLRAEGCWDTEGAGDDLDLHMAKVDNFSQCATTHSWSDLACENADEDCYYGNCVAGSSSADWGYGSSPAAACDGWGSQAGLVSSCTNPRLDRDANGVSGQCDPTVVNPNSNGLFAFNGPYCGPENINVDRPQDNERFAVGLRFYNQLGTTNPRVHVNIYCDGARVLTAGYDPIAGNQFPQFVQSGGDTDGDMWKVALVTTQILGGVLTCGVDSTQSTVPNMTRDGSTSYCVDNASINGPTSQVLLTSSGQEPANANALCYH